jgi:hypothetical protein
MIARFCAAAVVAIVALLPTVARAQNPQQAAIDQAVAQLEVLSARLSASSAPGLNRAPDSALDAMAKERLQLLLALVEEAPGEVLRLAVPSSVRDRLPAAARALTEDQVDVTGTVEISYEDHRQFSRLRHVLDTGTARYALHFATTPPGWMSGQRVRIRGVRVRDAIALNGDSTSTAGGSFPVGAAASGEQRVLMMLVNFRDNPVQPYTAAHAHDVVFGTTDGFFRESSAGTAFLVGDVLGWFTVDMDSTVCNTTTLGALAREAATSAGADLSQYSRFLYAFPQNDCPWWGLGSVGGSPSQAWINGDLMLEVAGHELGHNLGLYHSRSMDCGAASIGTSCTVAEYGDLVDLMGATKGHYNAFQKERLGWLSSSQIMTVAGTGTYSVAPFETLNADVKALKILKSVDPNTGKRTFYYVELRQAIGYDAFMSAWPNVLSGVTIHTGSESSGNTSYLLDMTPETASWNDPALTVGRTFSDPAAGLSLTVLSVSPTGATVSVALDPAVPACTWASPSVNVSPGAPTSVSPGTTVHYTVTVANNDSPACATATFALSRTVPANWTATFDAPTVSPASGGVASTMLHVTGPTNTAGGTYTVLVSAADAADSTHAGSSSATYTVVVPPPPPPPPPSISLLVSTDRSTYVRGNPVVMTGSVMAGSSPASGVTVAFRIRKPDGKYLNASATTNTNGAAIYILQLRKSDRAGTYQVTATTSANASVSASTAFTVK